MAGVTVTNRLRATSDSPSGGAARLAAHEFPHQRDGVYLNHAASAPMPLRASRALRAYADDRERLFSLYQSGTQDYNLSVLQRKLASLIGAPADCLTLVPTTTDAIAGTINSIDWRAGDNIVVPANEFPGVLYPCLHLAARGVEARLVPVDAHADLDRVLAAIDGRTRAVALSHVHWQTGHRLDLDRLGAECRARGVLSIVDAIQSVGAVPVNLANADVDVLTAGAYKWMMAMPGTAVLYVSPRFLAATVPDRAGYKGMAVDTTAVVGAPRIQWAAGAARFQVGGPINAAQHEVAVDDDGHAVTRVERQELRLARVAGREREHLALVVERLVLERELHPPRIRRARAVVERDHRAAPPPRIASSDAFCSSIVLMLICIMLTAHRSQFSMMRSSRDLAVDLRRDRAPRTSSPASETACAAPSPAARARAPAAREAGHRRCRADSTCFCMNSSASCGENGKLVGAPCGSLAGHAAVLRPCVPPERCRFVTMRPYGGARRNPAAAPRRHRRRGARAHRAGRCRTLPRRLARPLPRRARAPSCGRVHRRSVGRRARLRRAGSADRPAGRQHRPVRRRHARRGGPAIVLSLAAHEPRARTSTRPTPR